MHCDLILSQKYFKTEKQTDILTEIQREKLMDFCTSPSKRNLLKKKVMIVVYIYLFKLSIEAQQQ